MEMEARKTKQARQRWNRPCDFLFATVGYFVGLGNVWRFPYLCFENGGGAFLIPYILSVVFLAIPVLILESSFGQYCQAGVLKSWSRVPIFKGVGYAGIVCVFHSNVFYVIILTWVIKYMVASCRSVLPWTTCGNKWNTENCLQFGSFTHLNSTNATLLRNSSQNAISAAEEFWSKEVLGKSPGIEHLGSLRIDLVLYFVILWVAVYFSIFKGIKWSSKIVYVTATLPIILIVVVLVRGCTLDGAADGIYFYLVPDMAKLLKLEVWVSAATQVAYSVGTGLGTLVLLGSFNDYNHNFLRDSIIMGLCNSLSSFISGFAVFASLGFMANQLNTTLPEVAQSGPGLIFIAYPQSIALLPFPQIWSFLFFVTLLFLGFDSQFVLLEAFVNFVIDGSSRIRAYKWHREFVTGVVCFVMFLIGLLMVTEGGIYIFEIYNTYAVAGWCLFLLAGAEVVGIAWFYGLDNYYRGFTHMLGPFRGRLYLTLCWKFIIPAICLSVVVYFLAGLKPLKIGNYIFPVWAECIGHLMSLSSVIFIPGYAVYIKLASGKSFSE
uniref:Transporter n=1 Tax=Ciona savignyi TaxID=51511 RepID=H2Z312_CIOSA